MKIKNIVHNFKKDTVYDIETPSHNYILEGGYISHNTMELYSKPVIKGGKTSVLSSNDIWLVRRSQIKDGTDIIGWQFNINVDKSRKVKEKAIAPFEVTYEGGIEKYSGLLDIALLTGDVIKPKNGWFSRPCVEGDKSWRRKESNCDEFWEPLLSNEQFKTKLNKMYKLSSGSPMFPDGIIKRIEENFKDTLTNDDME